MHGYYKSLWKASYKKIRFYLLALFMVVVFAILGLNLFFNSSLDYMVGTDWVRERVYGFSIIILSTMSFVIFWYLFYKNIYDNSTGSNIEILSFTSGLTRTKIFFAKLLNHFTLSAILACLFTLIFFIISLSVYPISSAKLWLATLGHFLIAIFGSIFYFVLMFFLDMLMNKPRKKVTLAIIPMYTTMILYSFTPGLNSISKSVFLDKEIEKKGISDFENIHFLNKNFSSSDLISITDKSTYKDFDTWEDKNRDIDSYQKYTNSLKAINFFSDYFNFPGIVKSSLEIEKDLYGYDNRYNYHKELPQNLTNNFYSIQLNKNNQISNFYFKSLIWNYQSQKLSDSERKKEQKNTEDKIDELVTLLKNNEEFQKDNPNWLKLINFLRLEIMNTFSIEDKSYYFDLTADTNVRWIAIYVYLKATENTSKNLQLAKLSPTDDSSPKQPENEDYLKEQLETTEFYRYFVNSNEIFAYRSPISNYEYRWVSWIFIFVVIGGIGYWALLKYKNKDVA